MNNKPPTTIIALPAFLIVVLVAGVLGVRSPLGQALIQFPLALIYPIKLRSDVKHVNKYESSWKPSTNLYTFYGIVVAITLGMASLIVSPYYLYRRKSTS